VKRDYYEVLGVLKTAGHEEIRSAYRKLAVNIRATREPKKGSKRYQKPTKF